MIDSAVTFLRTRRGVLITAIAVVAAIIVVATSCGGGESTTGSAGGPTNLSWTKFNGVEVPVADQGPKNRTEPAPTGYERDSAGAALAAINAATRNGIARNDNTGQGEWIAVTRDLIAPGRGRDWWIAQRIRMNTTTVNPTLAPTVMAYKVTTFTNDGAKIDVFARQTDGSLTVNHLEVVWTAANDWGLVIPVPPCKAGTETTPTALPGQVTPQATCQPDLSKLPPAIEAVKEIPKDAVQLRSA
ncbi:hypothetical protein [Tsukamurella columbiensis]|uniref:DUF8175 domain-containing protein n=1 Tax=Tsukamurella columbiensis TaxID=128509 RepID=A0ABX1LJU4_9ACTN|nr:hypothetical protein [Tsukamurella columbiensis]NMD57994.1 hypothetical protein [Tsukamurella columbiensis]